MDLCVYVICVCGRGVGGSESRSCQLAGYPLISDGVLCQADKENRCCVCGKLGDYLRHHVVPHCYRALFPVHMKSHLSHDIVLLCQQCHVQCNVHNHVRMVALGQQYGAPLEQENHRFQQDIEAVRVKSAARALANKVRWHLPLGPK